MALLVTCIALFVTCIKCFVANEDGMAYNYEKSKTRQDKDVEVLQSKEKRRE